ncbi:hypothetical protein ACN47E_003430 [Coniothyrium glycines]
MSSSSGSTPGLRHQGRDNGTMIAGVTIAFVGLAILAIYTRTTYLPRYRRWIADTSESVNDVEMQNMDADSILSSHTELHSPAPIDPAQLSRAEPLVNGRNASSSDLFSGRANVSGFNANEPFPPFESARPPSVDIADSLLRDIPLTPLNWHN